MDSLQERNQKKLQELDKKIKKRYRKAYRDIYSDFLNNKKELESKDALMLKEFKEGKISREYYQSWRRKLEKNIQKDARKIASILGGADQLAVNDINMQIPEFYSDAENYQTYVTEMQSGINTNYTLVNKNSITRAMYGKFFADIDKQKNSKWNQRRIRSAITAGIIAGDSIEDIAKRLKPLVGGNENSAIRNARTWVGSAVTGGRQESAEKAKKAGVDLVKWWTAVHDLRTRVSHRYLDRTCKEIDERFDNGGLYPRDPDLPPAERYNCRCDVLYYPRGFTPNFDGQIDDFPDGMSYDDWLAGKDFNTSNNNEIAIEKEFINSLPEWQLNLIKRGAEDSSSYYQTIGNFGTFKYSNEFMKEKGITDEMIKKVDSLLNMHSNGDKQQEIADKEIVEHLEAGDELGKALYLQILMEEALYKECLKYNPDSWDRVYRKGKRKNGVEAWTGKEEGADMGYGGIGVDFRSDIKTLHKEGYLLLGGMGKMLGAPGEDEYTFIKFKKRKYRY